MKGWKERLRVLEQELKIRGFSKRTQKTYLHFNQKFLEFCKKDIRGITNQDIKNYLEYLIDHNLSRATVRLAYNSLLFYYTQVLGRRMMSKIKLPKREVKTIVPLTKEEIKNLIEVIENPKHRLLIEFVYASGLRVSEVVKFKVKDVLVQEKIGIVRKGKGGKDRKVILSEKFLIDFKKELREPESYLFPGRTGHLTTRSVQMILKAAAKKAGIIKSVHPHLLRHSFATHLLNNDIDIKYIQKILGHHSVKTTERYLHVSDKDIAKIKSPLD